MIAQLWHEIQTGTGHTSSFLRYLVTGCALFALDFAVWITCVQVLGWDVRPSQLLSRSVGALAGFFGHKYFSFGLGGRDQRGDLAVQGGSYLLVTLFNIAISPFVVFGAIRMLDGLPGALILGKIGAEAFLVVETYVLLRFIFVRRLP